MSLIVTMGATIIGGVVAFVTMVGALFTDSQWADIQSALNFIVLIYLAHQQRATRRDVPEAAAAAAIDAAEQTTDKLTHDEDVKVALAEVLSEALARRRRKVGL